LKSRGAIRLSPAGASPVPFWFTTRQLFEPLVDVGSQTGTFHGGAWMSLAGFVRRRLSPWEPPQRLGAGANVLPFQAKTSSSGLVPPPTRVKQTSRSPGVRLKSRSKVAPPLLTTSLNRVGGTWLSSNPQNASPSLSPRWPPRTRNRLFGSVSASQDESLLRNR